MGTDHKHRICTFEEADKAIRAHDVLYVNDCFCRTPAKLGKSAWKYCGHRTDLCMGFAKPEKVDPGFPVTEISQAEALKRFDEWKKAGNFFRFMVDDRWICYCCACGCGWLRDEKGNPAVDTCDKSGFIEKTDAAACNLCEKCVPVCAYKARKVAGDKMVVDSSKCYGCSACDYACEQKAISMVPRPKA